LPVATAAAAVMAERVVAEFGPTSVPFAQAGGDGKRREHDVAGRAICNAALWAMRPCGRGTACDFSHTVSLALRAKYDRLKEEKRSAKHVAAEAKKAKGKGKGAARPPTPPPLCEELERLRNEAVFTYSPEEHPLGALASIIKFGTEMVLKWILAVLCATPASSICTKVLVAVRWVGEWEHRVPSCSAEDVDALLKGTNTNRSRCTRTNTAHTRLRLWLSDMTRV
jgi:hypothetical protein